MNYFQRLQKAIMLDVSFYEEVENDKKFTDQAMMTVVLVSIVQGLMIAGFAPIALVQGILGSLVRFIIWAFFIAFVGTRILPEPETKSNTGELIRTLGFAYAPGLLVIFKVLPFINSFVDPIVVILQLAAMTIAVRQALDFNSTVRAVGVCIVAFLLMIVALTLFIGSTWFFLGIAENAIAPTAPLMET
ncbi:MAG: hypothetical protein L7S51_01560 [Candidatus Marinimicrobia bacterium]|jgi:hypothetical protein|nr:hypothetical protein [Candidatus Neomarinimicrobiota bacterium]|tara:strand:+ start:1652 stop:2218 length:567 start_codon:yes stop_codon:yes gene_type:complete